MNDKYTLDDIKRVQHRLLEMAIAIRDVLDKHNVPYFIPYGTLLGAIRHKGFIPWDDDFDFYLFDDTYEEGVSYLKDELPHGMFLEYFGTEPKYFHAWAHVKDEYSITDCDLYPQDSYYTHKGICVDLYRTKLIKDDEEAIYRAEEYKKYLERRLAYGFVEDKIATEIKISELAQFVQSENDRLASIPMRNNKDMYAFQIFYDDRLYVDEVFPLKKLQFENTEFWGPNKPETLLKRCYGDYMQLPPIEKRNPHYSCVKFL